MRINNSNINFYPIESNVTSQKPINYSNDVSFTSLRPSFSCFKDFCINPLNRFKNFSTDEYNKLSGLELKYLRRRSREFSNLADLDYIDYNDKSANILKTALDNKYGEGKYVVIPIGRSISSIGKTLGYKIGEDNVKMLPLSDARRFTYNAELNEDVKPFVDYLESIGLSKNDVATSDKNFVLIDYCESGLSLKGAKKLFEHDNIWGKRDNVFAEDFLGMLEDVDEEVFASNNVEDKNYFVDELVALLSGCFFKKYSVVDRCANLATTKDSIIKTKDYSKNMKYFWFNMLDKQMTKS